MAHLLTIVARKSANYTPFVEVGLYPREQVEGFAWTTRSIAGELMHLRFFEPARVVRPIKLAYDQRRPDGGSNYQPAPLTDWVSMPAVLVTGPTVMQNLSLIHI